MLFAAIVIDTLRVKKSFEVHVYLVCMLESDKKFISQEEWTESVKLD